MIVGYFRRIDDGEASPTAILRAERCLRIESDDPALRDAGSELIASLANGDVLVSPSIAHLAASTAELLRVARAIHARGATLRLVAEQIDTSIAAARNVLATLGSFDGRVLNDRRRIGLSEAKLRGAAPGRPCKIDDATACSIRDALASGRTYASVARDLGVHPTTIMRLARRATARDDE
jgi:DNA invertase Pin-like site-specific DNA recombinase